MADDVLLGSGPLSARQVMDVARRGAKVAIVPDALETMESSRGVIDALATDKVPHYGVSTGFGALATKQIPHDQRSQLQRSLIRSHAASSGAWVDREVVRALMVNRLATMCTGRTGVRPVVAQSYAAILNAGITPAIGEYGSLGCSGDLAPLSHCAMVLIGEGEVLNDNDAGTSPASEALSRARIEPVTLREKEGLALINGTDGMLGMLLMAIEDLRRLYTTADIAAAMTIEALLGTDSIFSKDLHELRPQPGQIDSAFNLRSLLTDSPLIKEKKAGKFRFTRVQDAYSLRCSPQVHGAGRDTLGHAARVAQAELRSAIDNPVVTVDGRVESNGNFHGAPVGYVLDFLAIAVADAASISERRTDRMLDKARNHGLNPFLANDPGVDSGHMIAQYTQAGIVSELKRLAVPSSVDSIPSSAMQEDHVSMGWSAGLKLRRAVDGLQRVIAIELLNAARALDMRDGGVETPKSSPALTAVRKTIREQVPGPGPDRYLTPEITALVDLVADGALLSAASDALSSPLN